MAREQLKIFGDVCKNNHGGNENSTKAYQLNRLHRKKQIRLLLTLIDEAGDEGRTSDELTIESELYIASVSARCSEMRRDKLVQEIGRRLTRRGSSAGVLVLTELGKSELNNGGKNETVKE